MGAASTWGDHRDAPSFRSKETLVPSICAREALQPNPGPAHRHLGTPLLGGNRNLATNGLQKIRNSIARMEPYRAPGLYGPYEILFRDASTKLHNGIQLFYNMGRTHRYGSPTDEVIFDQAPVDYSAGSQARRRPAAKRRARTGTRDRNGIPIGPTPTQAKNRAFDLWTYCHNSIGHRPRGLRTWDRAGLLMPVFGAVRFGLGAIWSRVCVRQSRGPSQVPLVSGTPFRPGW
jgi:hypothetical protein